MSVTKDGNTGKWMAQIRITDWQGKVIHKKKRGFKTKKEASQWEAEIAKQANADVGMLFKDFIELYFEDMSHRLKQSTLDGKHWMADIKITPIFGNMPLSEITANDVRRWQNALTSYRDEKGSHIARPTLKR